ncbi:Ketol-acid reductoisomerase like protein [Verticillium longisporum]|uniref:Ketol-acid reductoisomerase like protein n=1 Tax=Verticillium longisporum TaxID=100787 RepID=A0A8I3AR06_VERLO|nr:Ketol-acid reductoisomerase like protein [Verticillium longisporum]
MASRSFSKALRPMARQLTATGTQQRTFVAARSLVRASAQVTKAFAGPVQQQARGVKTVDFAGHKEDVYERADWPQEKLLVRFPPPFIHLTSPWYLPLGCDGTCRPVRHERL